MSAQQLYVRETGPRDAPTIVFLHGGGVSGWMWDPQASLLSSDYHCLVPDLPEHGRSRAIAPFTIEDAARRIADLIRERAHQGKAHVVGLSLGAQTLVQLLSTHPELIDHAIVSSALLRPIVGHRLINTAVKLYSPFKDIEPFVRANASSFGVPQHYYPQFRQDTVQTTTTSLIHILDANATYRLPVLVVIGQKEIKAMYQSARDLTAALPRAQAYLALNQNHNWSLEQPDLYTRMIRAWLNNQPLPPALKPLGALS